MTTLVIGSGLIGSQVARILVEQGEIHGRADGFLPLLVKHLNVGFRAKRGDVSK